MNMINDRVLGIALTGKLSTQAVRERREWSSHGHPPPTPRNINRIHGLLLSIEEVLSIDRRLDAEPDNAEQTVLDLKQDNRSRHYAA